MILRPYQKDAVEALWNDLFSYPSALCVLATAGGKTEIFFGLLKKALAKKPNLKALVLVNKLTLIDQTKERMEKAIDASIGVFCGSKGLYETDKSITIASIQSVYDATIPGLNLIIADEAHNINQDDGRYLSFIELHKKLNQKLKLVGFTASPYRTGSGYIFGEGKLFPKISYMKTAKELIAEGYLVPYTLKHCNHQFDTSKITIENGDYKMSELVTLTTDQDKVTKQVIDALPKLALRKKIVWACTCIEHAEILQRLLQEIETCAIVHSKLSLKERENNINLFENTDCRHLVFITIVSEGYNFCPVDAVVFMRPTRSPVLYIQTLGRALRLSPEKTDALLLDYGQVIQNQGLPEHVFDNQKKSKKEKKLDATGFKFCPECKEYQEATNKACTHCDYIFEVEKRDYIKNLTEEAFSIIDIPTTGCDEWVICTQFKNHISKAGNPCRVIEYRLFDRTVSEFFPEKSWGIARFNNRLKELLASKLSLSIDELNKELEDSVAAITTVMENGYVKVKTIKVRPIADRKRNRTSDPTLSESTANDVRDKNQHDRSLRHTERAFQTK